MLSLLLGTEMSQQLSAIMSYYKQVPAVPPTPTPDPWEQLTEEEMRTFEENMGIPSPYEMSLRQGNAGGVPDYFDPTVQALAPAEPDLIEIPYDTYGIPRGTVFYIQKMTRDVNGTGYFDLVDEYDQKALIKLHSDFVDFYGLSEGKFIVFVGSAPRIGLGELN